MLFRKAEEKIRQHFDASKNKALLVTGARQVGKTYSIRHFLQSRDIPYVEFNFIEDKEAAGIFEQAQNRDDLLFRLSAMTTQELIPGETVFFFDEVQECPEMVTAIKFLVEEGSYRYILSGSLLGVELKDIRSMPVGYLEILEMYPLDLEEFCRANGVSERVLEQLRDHFLKQKPVDPLVHSKMMDLFQLYLIVGGMPAVVAEYCDSNNLQRVVAEQQSILQLYKRDIARYDPENKLYLEDIFDLIPAELNAKNKRFILKDLHDQFKFSRNYLSFLWLKDAGVAHPVYCVDEPVVPLKLSQATNKFKLFLSDVGLLAAMYMNGIQRAVLAGDVSINFGSIYENAVAQELKAHGYDLYYYNNKKRGEVDFVVEEKGEVLPIEVKSGKDYQIHRALNNLLGEDAYGISRGLVFSGGNLKPEGAVLYAPIYMIMFLVKEETFEDPVYRLDLSVLQ